MSGLGVVLAIAIGLLVVAVEIAIVWRVARRLIPVARALGDPAKRAMLLSEETRDALRRAGVDPESFDPSRLGDDPELKRRVTAELKTLLSDAFRGRVAASNDAGPRAETASLQASLPPPIDDASGNGLRLAIAVLAIGGAALWLVSR